MGILTPKVIIVIAQFCSTLYGQKNDDKIAYCYRNIKVCTMVDNTALGICLAKEAKLKK